MAAHPSVLSTSNGNDFLAEIYRRYWPGLCRHLHANFGNGPPSPEDIAQSAFSNLAELDDPQIMRDPRAFLYRTARNIALRQHQREGIGRRISGLASAALEETADEINPERILIAKERCELLDGALHAMPAERRRMLILNRLHGLSYAEISRRTGVSQTHVKRLVAHALTDCKQALDSRDSPFKDTTPRASRGKSA
jgi:RNA polymerase sigma-70 factor (ECF subfamily)